MTTRKIIAVTGATGAQGGGLLRAILADANKTFAVRAITRHPDGDKARALRAAGAEVVGADLDDAASLASAFRGAHGAFCVTNFWEHFSAEKEYAQAKNLADAARAAGVAHCVWSSFEDTRKLVPLSDDRMPTLHGKYKVPHFDGKAEANPLFAASGVPTTIVYTSFYWENLIYFGMGPKKMPDGSYALVMPMGSAKLPGIAAEDIGRCVFGVFARGAEFIGRTIGIAGDHPTAAAMAASLARATHKDVRYQEVTPEAYRAFGFPGADDLGNMFQYKRDFEALYCAARPLELSRSLNPALLSFDAWLAANAQRIPLE